MKSILRWHDYDGEVFFPKGYLCLVLSINGLGSEVLGWEGQTTTIQYSIL